jgi:hypothetical protein
MGLEKMKDELYKPVHGEKDFGSVNGSYRLGDLGGACPGNS